MFSARYFAEKELRALPAASPLVIDSFSWTQLFTPPLRRLDFWVEGHPQGSSAQPEGLRFCWIRPLKEKSRERCCGQGGTELKEKGWREAWRWGGTFEQAALTRKEGWLAKFLVSDQSLSSLPQWFVNARNRKFIKEVW